MAGRTVPANHAPVELPWLEQFWILSRLQYTDYRFYALMLLIFGLIMPVGVFWLLRHYVGTGPETVWLLAGNMVLAISYGATSFAIYRVGSMKHQGQVDFYATLPIARTAFMAAIFALALLSALPGLLVTTALGHLLIGVAPGRLVWALPLAILAAASLTTLGVAIGSLTRSMTQTTVFSNLTYLVVTFLCPVVLPLEQMPLPMRISSYLLPPGQAALALQSLLAGRLDGWFWLLTGLLVLWLLMGLWLAVRALDWLRR